MASAAKQSVRPDRAGRTAESLSRKLPRWAALLGPALFAVALYLPSLGNPLVWDDELHVPLAREMTVGEAFGNAGGEYRRPLVLLSYLAQWKAGAGADAALHAVNVLLHSGNAMLLALLLLNMGLPTEVAACAALLFAAHPLQSGSVAYVSGRTDLLAAAFTMTALIVAQPAPSRTEPASTRVRSTSRSREMCVTLACAACVALAALSKEIGLVAGPLAALFVYYRIRRGRPASLLTAIAALMSCACCALWVLPPAALAANLPMSLRLRAAGTAAVTYAGLLVWPSGLHLDRLSPTRGDEALVIALALCALAAALSLRFARAPTLAGLGLLSVLALYLPGSGLIPVAPAIVERFVFTPEQFLYLPLAPLCALLAAALHRYSGNSALLVVTATLALASVPAVLARQREFAGAEQVYRATLAHSSSARACFNLGGLQLDDLRYAEAASSYERCVELSPHDGGARGQLAIAYQKLGRADQARANYRRAIELDDRSPLLWSNFATLDANEGRYGDAREKWQHALALDPSFPPALSALEKLERAMSR